MKTKSKKELKDLLSRSNHNIESLSFIIRNITTTSFDEVTKVLNQADCLRIEIKEAIK